MELLNASGMQAGFTMGMRPDGRELLVVAIKGTFRIPPPPLTAMESVEKAVSPR